MSRTLIFAATLISFLSIPFVSFAGISLPWSTTYNCSDWNKYSDPLNCDGISKKGSWVANPEGYAEQITSAANYPGGAGGKGQRHWIGDGTNNNSGGTQINFNSPQSNFWMRWYMRWEKGFGAFGLYKVLYAFTGSSNGPCFDYGPSGRNVNVQYLTTGTEYSTAGWGVQFYPSMVSDGSWVLNEIHVDVSSGRVQWWINEELVMDRSVQFKGPVSYILVGENQKTVSNGRSMYIDYDDIAISNKGYIGPLSGGGSVGGSQDTTAPSVSMTSPSSNQTVSGNMTISANASDDTGVAGVQFKLNGQNIGSEDTSAPYSLSFDTSTHANGDYTLSAVARDAAGNQTNSGTVDFTINNATSSTPPPTTTPPANALLSESFDDSNFSARGWYDNTNMTLSSTEHISGSTKSIEFHFPQGAVTPTSGSAMRKLIAETDSLYVSYYVKYSSNWVGSNQSYHPHEFFIMTNIDGKYDGMAATHLTAYIEQNALKPQIIIQDSDNIDTSNINTNLVGQTEQRSVAGCNGDSDGYGAGSCYQSNSAWRNVKYWQYNSPVITAGTWHKVEAYLKLNSISGGIGQKDGVMQYWLDGKLLIDHHDAVFRTGQHPTMKFNQFIIAPYIGDGSPIDQYFWVDDLTVATSSSSSSTSVETPSGLTVVGQPN